MSLAGRRIQPDTLRHYLDKAYSLKRIGERLGVSQNAAWQYINRRPELWRRYNTARFVRDQKKYYPRWDSRYPRRRKIKILKAFLYQCAIGGFHVKLRRDPAMVTVEGARIAIHCVTRPMANDGVRFRWSKREKLHVAIDPITKQWLFVMPTNAVSRSPEAYIARSRIHEAATWPTPGELAEAILML